MIRVYRCGGVAGWSGPCGAPDCASCYPGTSGCCSLCGDLAVVGGDGPTCPSCDGPVAPVPLQPRDAAALIRDALDRLDHDRDWDRYADAVRDATSRATDTRALLALLRVPTSAGGAR